MPHIKDKSRKRTETDEQKKKRYEGTVVEWFEKTIDDMNKRLERNRVRDKIVKLFELEDKENANK